MIYCYIRKSTDKQAYNRQINILKENHYYNNINCTYVLETYTGKSIKRPELDNLINTIQKNDTIVCESLSRLSRGGLLKTLELINYLVLKKEINIIILKENFNLKAGENMDAITKLLINIFSSFSEFERDILSERTKEGLKATKKRLGRPTDKTLKDFIKALNYNINGFSVNDSVRLASYPKSSFIYNLKELRKKYNIQDKKELLQKIRSDKKCYI